ncbi:Outer membrane protein transport protein (OMPP1/FadL/TodX) [Cyclonatronum proteinivorum]|uniref:Outer membrane protein transport protein (OMPP1/FadL/TodX) n=1 Tax=Cyclonatronum proteinivorum TaxID=1457365 RepID=A0A345UN33_9BACT|nr:outer membrane protein transport protein [Cyclonatronum proteinivorum]AXJ01885.1 Outer membrane protein transport protein (OMPP1/FadL/TodX) [Cyclonatronum proteinivorum]
MTKKLLLSLLPLMLCLSGLFTPEAEAQNRFDALRFSTQLPASDPNTIFSGGSSVATFTGFGSSIINPATLGLARESEFHIGIGMRDVNEDATFLNRTAAYDDAQTAFTNAGFLYAAPTVQGSLVAGFGYNQLADFNRAYRLSGFNPRSSITDLFFDNSFYFNTAFNAFAIEENDFGQFPIFREDFDAPFRGITQAATVRESGQLGEFSAAIATEFVQNLFIGASLGIPVGSYTYRRNFLERDIDGLFGPIDTEIGGEPFTIPAPDGVLLQERISADIIGFSARIGAIYRPLPNFQVGLSYSLPTTLNIDESYSVFIQTEYEDGTSESAQLRGETSYQVKLPARFTAGFATTGLPVNLSFAAERVSNSSIQFRDFDDLSFEVQENENMREDFRDVINFRFGASLNITEAVIPSIGYAYLPAVSREAGNARQLLSAGVSVGVNQSLRLDAGLQYMFFDDEQIVYEFFDYEAGDGSFAAETIRTSVERFHAVVGIVYRF